MNNVFNYVNERCSMLDPVYCQISRVDSIVDMVEIFGQSCLSSMM